MTSGMRDPKILTTHQAAAILCVSQRAMEKWRETNNPKKPPFVRSGSGKRAPVFYHADLLQPGSYAVGGLVETFPEPLPKAAPELAELSSPRVMELLEDIIRQLADEPKRRGRRVRQYTDEEYAEYNAAINSIDKEKLEAFYKSFE